MCRDIYEIYEENREMNDLDVYSIGLESEFKHFDNIENAFSKLREIDCLNNVAYYSTEEVEFSYSKSLDDKMFELTSRLLKRLKNFFLWLKNVIKKMYIKFLFDSRKVSEKSGDVTAFYFKNIPDSSQLKEMDSYDYSREVMTHSIENIIFELHFLSNRDLFEELRDELVNFSRLTNCLNDSLRKNEGNAPERKELIKYTNDIIDQLHSISKGLWGTSSELLNDRKRFGAGVLRLIAANDISEKLSKTNIGNSDYQKILTCSCKLVHIVSSFFAPIFQLTNKTPEQVYDISVGKTSNNICRFEKIDSSKIERFKSKHRDLLICFEKNIDSFDDMTDELEKFLNKMVEEEVVNDIHSFDPEEFNNVFKDHVHIIHKLQYILYDLLSFLKKYSLTIIKVCYRLSKYGG